MDSLICNKCFVPIYRGQQPFHITQCGHIFCQNCIQQVEERCPQCQYISPAYLSLEEPVMPKIISFLAPLENYTEIWEMLSKTNTMRSNQIKITMQRFRELDEKYEKLKQQCFQDQRNYKILTEKYTNLKKETEKIRKNIEQMRNSQVNSIKTPTVSYPISMSSSSTRYTPESLDFLKFSNATPMSESIQSSIDTMKQYQTDSFRSPCNPSSAKSRFTSDTEWLVRQERL